MKKTKQKRRNELLRTMLSKEKFPHAIIKNPSRFSKALGVCETGSVLTSLLAVIFDFYKDDEESVVTIVFAINEILSGLQERNISL